MRTPTCAFTSAQEIAPSFSTVPKIIILHFPAAKSSYTTNHCDIGFLARQSRNTRIIIHYLFSSNLLNELSDDNVKNLSFPSSSCPWPPASCSSCARSCPACRPSSAPRIWPRAPWEVNKWVFYYSLCHFVPGGCPEDKKGATLTNYRVVQQVDMKT